MNKFLQLTVITLCSLLINSAGNAASKAQPLDGIVAVANNIVITQSDLDQALNNAKKQLAASNTPLPPAAALRKQILNQLIDRKLQLDMAEQNGIAVSDAEVNKAIEHIASSNNLTVPQLYEKLSQEKMSIGEYRKEIRDEITLQQVQQQALGTKITVLPEEVDDFMRSAAWQANRSKEYHLEDILIALPEAPTPEQVSAAKNQANNLLSKLHHGLNFHEAAASESGTANALEGGDLGWRKLPEIPSAFVSFLSKAKENELLGPIQTPNGFHIIQVTGIRETGNRLAQRKEVEALIYQRKYQQAVQTWLTKLRSQSFINTHPGMYA